MAGPKHDFRSFMGQTHGGEFLYRREVFFGDII